MTHVIISLARVRLRNARDGVVATFMALRARLGLLPPPQVRRAAAHWRKGVTYVHAIGQSAAGALKDMPPVQRFSADAASAEVGAAVLASLAA